MTSIPAAHPMPAHTTRKVVKAMTAAALFSATAFGLYHGAQLFTAHTTQPTQQVSYATEDTIARTLAGANHTPATAGDFIDGASIQTADVVSVVKAVK